jgi:hypothetical protein
MEKMKLLATLVCAFAVLAFAAPASAQDEETEEDSVSGDNNPYHDPAETIPYYEEYVNDEPEAFAESTCERVEVEPEDQIWYYTEVALPPKCDTDCDEEREDAEPSGGYMTDGGTGPRYYTDYPHTCDYDLTNWVRIKAGSNANAGTTASIWMCFGQHYENYTYPTPDYDRPETLWYDDTPAGQDAACYNLGQGPSSPNSEVYYYFCDYDDWYDFFSYLEPDDWDQVRFWTGSSDGLQIAEIEIMHDNQRIYEETGINFWMDKYYGRQMFLDWRIARYKHDLLEAIVGEAHMNPILEVAAQDLGRSGARKYNGEDKAWCSEFAVYVIQNGSALSAACSGIPTPLVTGNIDVSHIYTWLNGCNRTISYASLQSNPGLLKPGYYLSLNNRGHSVIFVGWVSTVGGEMWVIDGNGHCDAYGHNAVCLYTREWSNVLSSDFAGNTH